MWGDTDLNIVVGSAKPLGVSGILVEASLLPNPSDLTAIATVLHQKGRKRKRYKARLIVEDISDYYAFQDDAYGTSRTLKIEVLSVNGSYTIIEVGEPELPTIPWDPRISFDIVWIEGAV